MADKKITELAANDAVEDTDILVVVQDTVGGGTETRQVTAAELADYLDAEVTPPAANVVVTPAGGIAATDAQAALEELDGDITAHIDDASAAHASTAIAFTPASGIVATDVQAAVVEVAGDVSTHLGDPATAHAASAITFTAFAGDLAATDALGAIEEVEGLIDNHIADTEAAHDATAISFSANFGTLTATDAASAIEEVENLVMGVIGADAGWAVTNAASVKTFDADSTTLDEVADVLGTLIASLIAKGIIQAPA